MEMPDAKSIWFTIVTVGDFILNAGSFPVKLNRMQTVDKAMALLGMFSPGLPEAGLSELARRAGYDKAATRRFLVALGNHGFIEQNGENRKYRLGPACLRIARVREATRPLASIIQPALESLAREAGETAHASLFSGGSLATIAAVEPRRPTRVSIDPAGPLPFHATASGIACLAHLAKAEADALLGSGRLKRHTGRTAISRRDLQVLVDQARARGYARADRSFEDEVIGTAAVFFDWDGRPAGAIAVAAVASRFSRAADALIGRCVMDAAAAVTRATGGIWPGLS
jgi:IclR family transcriptional regulator, acetate operon repressor